MDPQQNPQIDPLQLIKKQGSTSKRTKKEKPRQPLSSRLDTFANEVMAYISCNQIICISDVIQLYEKYVPSFKWSASTIAKISDSLVQEYGLFRIDLTVPEGKPLELYEGHHRTTSTSFFVSPMQNPEISLQLANSLLDDMVTKAKERLAIKKSKKFERKSHSEPVQKEASKYSTKFRFVNNGWVSCRRNRQILIHIIAIHHFGKRPFTLKEFLEVLSVDLYIKIIGSDVIPNVFIVNPFVRQILIHTLPKKYLDIFCYDQAEASLHEDISRILQGSSINRKYGALFYTCDNIHYQVIPRFRIVWLDHPPQIFNVVHITQAIAFWKRQCLFDLTELISPSLANLWRKRYLRLPQNKPAKLEDTWAKYSVMAYIHDHQYPLNFDDFERFSAAIGQDHQPVKECLKSISHNIKDPLVQEYCHGILTTFKPDPIVLMKCDEESIINNLSTTDPVQIINRLTAFSSITPDGLHVNLPKPFKRIASIISQHCNESLPRDDIGNHHAYLLSMFKDYFDLYQDNCASISYSAKQFCKADPKNCFQLLTSDYIDRFSITLMRMNMHCSIGELIERLKTVSVCPSAVSEIRVAIPFIQQVYFRCIDAAIYYLKLSRFLSQKMLNGEVIENSPYVFGKGNLRDFRLNHPSDFYSQYLKVKEMMQFSQQPNVASTVSTCAFFLTEQQNVQLKIVPLIKQSKKKTQAMSDLFQNNNNSKSVERLTATRYVLPLIKLVDFDVSINLDLQEKAKFTCKGYPVDLHEMLQHDHNEIYVVLYQLYEESRSLLVPSRFVQGYIEQNFSKGASFDRICFDNQLTPEQAASILEFLEDYQYVTQINSERAMPQFVGGQFAQIHMVQREYNDKYMMVRQHFWVRPNGEIDHLTLSKLLRKLTEIIEMNPGIELLALTSQMPSLSLKDLLTLLDLLELDEVISSVYQRVYPATLLTEETIVIYEPQPNVLVEYEFANWLKNPEKHRIQRLSYPTINSTENLSWIGDY